MHIRQTPEIEIARLQELFLYNKEQGEIYLKKSNRRILPYPEIGTVAIYDGESKLRKTMLFRNLAYVLGTGESICSKKKVLTLDLDDENIKFHNLRLVDRSVYRAIKLALRNLNGALQIKQHDDDKHAYIVTWLEHKRERILTFYDIAAAEKCKQDKLVEIVKFVNQYIRSE